MRVNKFHSFLNIENVDAAYPGGIQVLWSVSFHVEEGEIVTLIGSNGAGKSTTIKIITGGLRPSRGEVRFEDQSLGTLSSHQIVERGISQIPEGRQLFPFMTVRENLELGSYPMRARKNREKTLEWIYTLFPVLMERQHQLAGSMSGGEQQMVAIGRGLMANPKLLLVDELSLGLAPFLVKELFRTMVRINKEGVTILMVEQNVKSSLEISKRALVMENGRITLSGQSEEILSNDYVKKVYLGL
jgi:branched-chain amino acid transport system ATP-binding protein